MAPSSPSQRQRRSHDNENRHHHHHHEAALSVAPTAVLVFLTHGAVNTLLLSPLLSPYRCLYWNQPPDDSCDENYGNALNGLALAHFHVFFLLACLFFKVSTESPQQQQHDEERLVSLCIGLLVSFLTTTVLFWGNALHRGMAVLQCVVHAALLATLLIFSGEKVVAAESPRRKSQVQQQKHHFSLSTLAMALLFCLALFRCYHQVKAATAAYHEWQAATTAAKQGATHLLQQATALAHIQVAWILGHSIHGASTQQQQRLAVGHAVVMFVTLLLLARSAEEQDDVGERRLYGIGAFCSLLIALLGVF